MKLRGLGTTLSYLPAYNSADNLLKLIGALTTIGEIAPKAEELDATTLDSANGYKEFIQGMKDSGELSVTGFHDKSDVGQVQCRTLFGSGTSAYFWISFTDGTQVMFNAWLKGYTAGAADVAGIVGFGATFRISGIIEVVSMLDAVAQTKALNGTATLVSTATAIAGTPTYQWKTCTDLLYTGAANVSGGTGGTTASYTTAALTPAGSKYYFCVVTVTGFKPINGPIHVITVT